MTVVREGRQGCAGGRSFKLGSEEHAGMNQPKGKMAERLHKGVQHGPLCIVGGHVKCARD